MSKLEQRANIIKYIYRFELSNIALKSIEAFESGEFPEKEIKQIEAIEKSYLKLKKLVCNFTKDSWSWERIAPLERAILIYGAWEMAFNDKALVINELVIITRGYIPGDAYKWINSTLDKIGAYYETIKRS